jgi:small subunit ribosomal protein S20
VVAPTRGGQRFSALVQCPPDYLGSKNIGDLLVANHKSALKRIRSSEKRRQRNRVVRSRTRTEIKKARVAMESGDLKNAVQATREAIRQLDKAETKGVLHRNNVARRKSRLMKRLAQLQAQQKS